MRKPMKTEKTWYEVLVNGAPAPEQSRFWSKKAALEMARGYATGDVKVTVVGWTESEITEVH